MEKKTAIITGGAQGIGKVLTTRFVTAGYNLGVLDIDNEALKELRSELNYPDIHFINCDVSDELQVKNALNIIQSTWKGIDVLINNAAIGINKPIEKLSLNDWNMVLGVNLTGPFLCSKYAISALRKTKGSIINIASTRAFMSEANTEAYSASKGGIVSLTHALAISLGPDIRVNCISPGWIEVSQHKKLSDKTEPVLSEADHRQHPAGRVGKAEDIAGMALFLADKANGFLTGQNFIVDGGMTKKMIYV